MDSHPQEEAIKFLLGGPRLPGPTFTPTPPQCLFNSHWETGREVRSQVSVEGENIAG